MATLKVDGQDITLPKYNLSIMAVAAPFLDTIQRSLASGAMADMTISQANQFVLDTAGFLAAGAVRVDPTLTQDKLAEHFTMTDALVLQGIVADVLSDIGISMLPARAIDVAGADGTALAAE